MKKIYTLLSLLITLSLSTNLIAQTCSDGGYQWSDVVTIFENNGCSTSTCHGGGSGGLDLTTYDGFAAGGTKCGTEIFDGTNLVDIIQVGATCGTTGDGDGGTLGAMNNFIGTPVSDSDIAAIQAYIDSGAFEFCRGVPADDGFADCSSTIGALDTPAETNICTDGSNPTVLALPTASLPNIQIAVEVNGVLNTITDDGSFDYSILNAGDEVCYTAFTFDLDAINMLLETANGLCPTLDILFPDLLPCAPIGELVAGTNPNGGDPGLDDLNEVLEFAASLSSAINSVQSAVSVLDAVNGSISSLLPPVCYATSNNVCITAEECVASTCPVVYLNDDNLPSLPDALCEGELLSLCFDLLVDEASFNPSLVEFNYQLTFDGTPAAITLENSFSAGTQIDENANGQICFEAIIPEGPDPCQPFDIALTIESVFYRDDATCPSNNIGFALNLSILPASEGDDLNSLVPLLSLAGFNPLTLTGYPNPNWTATVTQAPACDGSTRGVVELYASNGTLCDTVADLGTAGADGECPANNAELPEYTYAAFETFTVPDQNEMDSIVVNPCAISVVVPAQTIDCVENCGPCTGEEVEVTFSLDMSCSGTDMRPPVVTGPFNGFSGDGNIMIDPDGDDIWEAVICIVPGSTQFEYKYAIENFIEQENLVDDAIGGATCDLNTNFFDFSNRLITIPAGGGALPTDAYGICGTCENPPINVTFSVDMNCSDVTPGTQVAMFGGFNGFCCPYGLEDSDGDNVWTTTLPFPPDESGCISMQYLYMSPDFSNVEAFLTNREDIANCPNIFSDFNEFANRIVEVCSDTVLDDHWNACSASAEPAEGCDDGDCTNGIETWDGCACISTAPTGTQGCTDASFCEYNPDADCDDGSCATSNADPGTCNTDCTVSDTEVWDAETCSCAVDVVTVLGCNDNTAANFDANANCNDGSCIYETCEDACAPNFGAPGACDPYEMDCNTDCSTGDIEEWDPTVCACSIVTSSVLGCTDETAINYSALANCDDGSCMYEMCTDPCAPNFEAQEACEPYDMDCNTDCTAGDIEEWDADACACAVVTATVLGCTDATATNYDMNANCDDESCTYEMCTDPCAPNFEAQEACEPYDTDCNTDCTAGDIEEWDSDACACAVVTATVLGCTDSSAVNYDMNANCDDESCMYEMCTDPCAPNFEAAEACEPYDMTCPEDDCFTTYTWSTDLCSCDAAAIDIVCIDEDECTTASIDETTCECVYETIPDCGEVEGCTDACASNYNSEATIDDGSCDAYDMTCPEDTCFELYTWDAESCECIVAAVDYNCDDDDDCTNDYVDEVICECVNEAIPDCGGVEPTCPTPGVIEDCGYELPQERLNTTTTLVVSETGGSFPHGGMDLTGDQTIRDIFTSDGNVGDEINPGFLITKHTYAVDASGNKGDLLVTFAMLKHGEGYWEDSNDWEYIMMPVDPTVDYNVNPNGIFANAAVSGNVHDVNPGCVGCHNGAGGGDQLFSND